MTCPGCGKTNPTEAVECEFCGDLLVDIFGPSRPGSEALDAEGEHPAAGAVGPAAEAPVLTAVLPRHARFGDRYEILELIGEGGMGRVYKARDLELDRLIALKTIRSEKGSDPETVRRFKQELVLARRITHKNVVRIYDLGEASGVKFFTMELLEGQSLKKIIQRDGRVLVPRATAMLRQMLSALEEAHNQGVIHRDLKPQNIMVSPDGTPHIMDFGIARSAESAGMTATGSVLGTPDYIAPEQVSGEETNAQTDLFSLGVILYEMLSGKVPFDADTPIGKVMMRLNQKPRVLREAHPEIPAYLERMVFKCLEVDPALRYQSAREVLDDLEREQVDRFWLLRARRALARRRGSLATAALLTLFFGAAAFLNRQGSDQLAQPGETAEAESVKTLAILPLVNATGSEELDWMRTGLAEMLVTDISQSRFVRPVPGERVFKLMRQLEIHEQSRFDEAALASIAELAPADSILYGQFVQLGDSVRMDLTLRDSGSGVPTPIKVDGNASDLLALVDRITEEVKRHLDLSPEQLKGDTDHPIAEVATGSLQALRAYQTALNLLRQGANQAAIPFFREATAQDPDFALAYAKLAESYLNVEDHQLAAVAIQRAQILSRAAPLPLAERYQIHALSAQSNHDYETAAKVYGELADLYPNDPDIRLSRARVLEELGQFPEALEAYQGVVESAPGYGAGLLGLARVQLLTGRGNEAIDSADAALKSGQFEDDPESLGLIHSIMGIAYRDTGRLGQATDHLSLALDFRHQAGDRRGEANTLTNLAAIYEQRGQIDRALSAEGQALAIARQIGNRIQESTTLYNMGLTYKFAGRLDEALQAFRESLQIEMERGDQKELAIRLGQVADTYRVRGQYADAMVYLEQARIHLERSDDQMERAFNRIYFGQVESSWGREEEAIRSFLSALADFQEIQHSQGVSKAELYLASSYSNQGRYAEAGQALERSLEIIRELGVGHDLGEAKAHRAQFFINVGQLELAQTELTEALEVAEQAHADDLLPLIYLGRARLGRLMGRTRDAETSGELAKREADRIGQKEISLRAGVELARISLQLGDVSRAEELLAEARNDAVRIGARPILAQATAALAEAQLARGDAESAYASSKDVIAMAEAFSGQPLLVEANAALADACQVLGRGGEALDAYSEVVAGLDRIKANLPADLAQGFMSRSDIQFRLERAAKGREEFRQGKEDGIH